VARTVLLHKDLFLQRCRDTADDDRGFIVAVDDDDLRSLVEEARNASDEEFDVARFELLRKRFDKLVM
jgi:hypothetical protein